MRFKIFSDSIITKFLLILTVKKVENWSIFEEVIRRTKSVPNFLVHPVHLRAMYDIKTGHTKMNLMAPCIVSLQMFVLVVLQLLVNNVSGIFLHLRGYFLCFVYIPLATVRVLYYFVNCSAE